MFTTTETFMTCSTLHFRSPLDDRAWMAKVASPKLNESVWTTALTRWAAWIEAQISTLTEPCAYCPPFQWPMYYGVAEIADIQEKRR